MDEIVQMQRDTDGVAGMESHYYLQDDLFNVCVVTDDTGAVMERYEYGEYGVPEIMDAAYAPLASSAIGNEYLFQGRRCDPETGLYYYRTRYMDPRIGRFLSRDTIGQYGDPNNLGNGQAFVGNNPWSRLDPFGQQELGPVFTTVTDENGETHLDVLEVNQFRGIAEAHRLLLVDSINNDFPNRDPFISGLLNESLFMIPPPAGQDIVSNVNNGKFVLGQIAASFVPLKFFLTPLKLGKNFLRGFFVAEEVVTDANKARNVTEDAVRIARNQAAGRASNKLGALREEAVARITGGNRSGRIITSKHGRTDIDVIGPAGEFILVGGPGKARNLDNFRRGLRSAMEVAKAEGRPSTIQFLTRGTPQNVVDEAIQILGGPEFVKFFDDVAL